MFSILCVECHMLVPLFSQKMSNFHDLNNTLFFIFS